ncbi:hypothetical protein [Streptomyces sp. NPDC101237]|uniref:hypothetical protein n=1 Tax=Streptomyces sp. NPDC101237 TaxID=3366139 RepID=UPI00382DC109
MTLLDASPAPVDLTGRRLLDRTGQASAVPAGPPAAGAVLAVPLSGGARLGDRGGAITLTDAAGLKGHGVSCTAGQAAREGWWVVF